MHILKLEKLEFNFDFCFVLFLNISFKILIEDLW